MRADRRLKLALIDRIGMWIVELGRLTAKRPHAIAGEHERLRSEVLPMWRDLGVGSELVDELPPLPAVAQHNDLGSWNVVADGSDFVVVDWENVREVGLPLWDLVYFLADALVLIDGSHHPRERPTRVARLFAGEAPSSPQLFTWVRRAVDAAAIPHDAVGAIVTLCWLAHSLSVHAHNRDLTTWTPDEPPRVHGFEGMADAWMQHPALGPRWPAWQT
jgi:hypothetical protein